MFNRQRSGKMPADHEIVPGQTGSDFTPSQPEELRRRSSMIRKSVQRFSEKIMLKQ
jgi:hypothetical protein